MTNDAVTVARQDLIAALDEYEQSKARSRFVSARKAEADGAASAAGERLIAAQRALAKAADRYVAGEIDDKAYAAAHTAVEKAEAAHRAAVDLARRIVSAPENRADVVMLNKSDALYEARETFAAVLTHRELGVDDLRGKLLRGFAAWLWGRRVPASDAGSENLFDAFVGQLIDPPERDEVIAAAETIRGHFADLPEWLQP